MTFDILTLFPPMFNSPFDQSIVKRAQQKRAIKINIHDLRNWAIDKRGTVDDRPYGGGVGMIMRVEPIYKALEEVKSEINKSKVILMDARGAKFTQEKAREYSKLDELVIICGHYEGVDQRVVDHLIDESISIGDYVLTGGEIPAMVIVDAVTRLIPGVLEKPEATLNESFSNLEPRTSNLGPYIEHPQYTRPEEFNGWTVPKVLLSGNHGKIKQWREDVKK